MTRKSMSRFLARAAVVPLAALAVAGYGFAQPSGNRRHSAGYCGLLRPTLRAAGYRVGRRGIEPRTIGLKVRCSAN
jgi:hypothetical protein